MSREVRKVPANWVHPKDDRGAYKPKYNQDFLRYLSDFDDWLEARNKWIEGFRESYEEGEKWKPIEDEYKGMSFEEYGGGGAPDSRYYMPTWKEEEKTHFMMYETTSEGTPISPAFSTEEELARWLADNNASTFGRSTTSYENWLAMIKAGSSIASMAFVPEKGLISGVDLISA